MAEIQQLTLFDYAGLDAETRIVVQQKTSEIKGLMKRAAQDIVDIGQKLIEVKQRLGYGKFGDWIRAEFNWDETTARRFMRVAENFKTVNLTDLTIAPSALYLLASPLVAEEARVEIIGRATQGEGITLEKTRETIAEYKPVGGEWDKTEQEPTHTNIVGKCAGCGNLSNDLKDINGEMLCQACIASILNQELAKAIAPPDTGIECIYYPDALPKKPEIIEPAKIEPVEIGEGKSLCEVLHPETTQPVDETQEAVIADNASNNKIRFVFGCCACMFSNLSMRDLMNAPCTKFNKLIPVEDRRVEGQQCQGFECEDPMDWTLKLSATSDSTDNLCITPSEVTEFIQASIEGTYKKVLTMVGPNTYQVTRFQEIKRQALERIGVQPNE